MNIKDTFLRLTAMTYPYGYEESLLSFLPIGTKMDVDGNYYYEVGTDNKVIFASHLDTACKNQTPVKHKFDGKFIRTNGKTILGADDKAGVTILLYMIHKNVPGLYYFFVGEEVGCIGSTAAAKRIEFFSNFNKIVSFDRRGTTSIITHQSSKRSCSDEFANSLSKEYAKYKLNLEKDDTGVYTDSAEFTSVIPECTNISVGYYNEHTYNEHQDIEFLTALAEASVLVDWESLEVKRDPSKTEWKKSSYSSENYYYYGGTTSYRSSRTRRGKKHKYSYDDDDYIGSKYKRPLDFYIKDGQKIFYNDIENQMLRMEENKFQAIDNENTTYTLFDDLSRSDMYRGVRDMFLDDKITIEEFSIIKEQCLNMMDDSDIEFSNYMIGNII